MANNPLYQANSGANGATAPTNPVNDPNKPLKRRYNRFPMSHKVLNTLRYGDITPFLAFEGVEGDRVPFRSTHEIRSYTLKAPMMSDIRMNKDYFLVPYQAILPNNWAKIYVNPTQGDDAPALANCAIPDIRTYVSQMFQYLAASEQTANFNATNVLRLALLCEMFVSNGSLLASMNIHLSPLIKMSKDSSAYNLSFDTWFDLYYKKHYKSYDVVFYQANTAITYNVGYDGSGIRISHHRALEMMRNDPFFTLSNVTENTDLDAVGVYYRVHTPADTATKLPFNYGRCVAYQLCASHFYTNDKVDFLYSADLYRQNQLALATMGTSPNQVNVAIFDYNGVPTLYDALSGFYFDVCLASASTTLSQTDLSDIDIAKYAYLFNILGFRQSLRFGDYFTGARPSPLAVGDVNAPVVNGEVSAIDMTKNIMMQRFLNAVNRVGRKFGDYVRDIMDGAPAPDSTDPKFLAHQTSFVSGFEVENTTSQNQGAIVTNLRSSGSDFAFEVSVENPCIILGLASFDVARVYSRTITKHAMKLDRFDMFNPYMQYIGDQEINASELSPEYLERFKNFAYTLRHMEYKQAINYASGGFVENLPAWAFITDNRESGTDEIPNATIDPEYIRSSSAELDRFYASLTGDSLATYFHFIVKFDNDLNPARAMEFAPTIL